MALRWERKIRHVQSNDLYFMRRCIPHCSPDRLGVTRIYYDLVLSSVAGLTTKRLLQSPVVRTKERPFFYIIVLNTLCSSFTMRTGFFAPYFHQCPMAADLAMYTELFFPGYQGVVL